MRPVPTGTDCSDFDSRVWNVTLSRPYGDGLFQYRLSHPKTAEVPSLRGRIVLNYFNAK